MEESKMTFEQQREQQIIAENLQMEFDAEMAETEETLEIDHELMMLQKGRKSMPRVIIEEFVDNTSDNDEGPTDDADGKKERPHKLKTHYEIDDVSTKLTF
jgi:hypothetical protein